VSTGNIPKELRGNPQYPGSYLPVNGAFLCGTVVAILRHVTGISSLVERCSSLDSADERCAPTHLRNLMEEREIFGAYL
jgi:hypothetical protein